MLIINDVIVSRDLLEEQFICDLKSCKGVCCEKGDYGAPLTPEEIISLKKNLPQIVPYLTREGRKRISETGGELFEKELNTHVTPLIDPENAEDSPCAFITYDESGRAGCGIEKAWEEGQSSLKKPSSCHLYPVRVKELNELQALNYDRQEFCSAGCSLGRKQRQPLFRFVREALVIRFGAGFYEALEHQYKNNEWSPKRLDQSDTRRTTSADQ